MSPDDPPVPLTPAETEPAAFVPDEYDPLRASQLSPPTPRPAARPMDRSRLRTWLLVGGVLWAVGLAGWLVFFVQGCRPDPDPGPAVKKKK
jgi:hypothetical protein